MKNTLATFAAILLLVSGLRTAGAAQDLVLVAGATGRTGREVVRELQVAGYPVRALVRDAAAARARLGDTVDYATGDVRQRATLGASLEDVHFVIVAIGATRDDPANGPQQVDYEGVRNLAEAAAAAQVDHFVLVSSAGVTQPDHILNHMFGNVLLWKAKGEAAVRASGIPYTIIRPGGLTDQPGGERGVRLEQGDRGSGFIPRADLARICVASLASPTARYRTFEAYSAPPPPATDWSALFHKLVADSAAGSVQQEPE